MAMELHPRLGDGTTSKGFGPQCTLSMDGHLLLGIDLLLEGRG